MQGLLLLSLMACVCCASALKCFICNSLSDNGCTAETLSKEYLIDCSIGRNNGTGPNAFKPVPDAKVCWKQRQNVEGVIIEDRMCGVAINKDENTCYDRVGTKNIKVRYCVCDTDKCNGSSSLAASFAGTCLLALLAAFFARP